MAASERPSWTRSIAFQSPSTGIGFVVRKVPSPVRSRRSTCRPPPCHAVTVTHAASSVMAAGSTRTVAPPSLCIWTDARTSPGFESMSPLTTLAPTAIRATSGTARRIPAPIVSSRRSRPSASSAPQKAPDSAATVERIRPSTRMSPVHGSGIATWLHPHSVAKPTVPIARPDSAAKAIGRRT
jgi:hypothetical protein